MTLGQAVCQNCAGSGILACSCYCKQCGGTGSVSCDKCRSGQVSCQKCLGTGRIQEHRTFLFFSYKLDRACGCVNGKRACSTCQGSGRLKCATCNGLKYQATCAGCKGTRQVTCAKCNGSGRSEISWKKSERSRTESESGWRKSLASMSKEDLRFEHEKYRANRASLENTLLRLENCYNRVWDRYQQGMDQAEREGWLGSFNFEGYRRELAEWKAQIENCQAQIRDACEGLSLIEIELKRLSTNT